jgi:transposase
MSENILFIGVDLHKEFCQIAVLREDKSLSQHRVPTEREALRSFIGALHGERRLVVEACGNWYFFHQCVADLVGDFALAHPLKVKAIASARIKTDKIDAATLAHLLRADLIPRCYIPTLNEVHHRELLRHRMFLVKGRTQMKCRLRATLMKNGLKPPVDYIWGTVGRAWLDRIEMAPVFRIGADALLNAIDNQTRLIEQSEKVIRRRLVATPEAQALCGIAGIGEILALTISSEVGDASRFSEPAKLASYAGLVPSTYSSGSRTINGRITKQGSRYLRWALIEAAMHAWKKDEQLSRIRERVKRRKGTKAARVAVARRLAEIVWHKLRKLQQTSSK